MPALPRQSKARTITLTPRQRMELVLPSRWQRAAEFPDEATRAAAWAQHRDDLLANCRPGVRPAAWWVLDKGVEPPTVVDHRADEAVTLARMGELSAREITHYRELARRTEGESRAAAEAVLEALAPPGEGGQRRGAPSSTLDPPSAPSVRREADEDDR